MLNELGNSLTESPEVWTGTAEGKSTFSNCDDWSSTNGIGTQLSLSGGYYSNWSCSETFALLCVEQ